MATAPKTIKIPMASVVKGMEVNVKLVGLRRWYLRLQLGLVLMRFALWISGVGCKIEEPKDGST